MKRLIITSGLIAAAALPAVAVAHDGKPTGTDRQNAAQECRGERGTTDATREAFRAKYGTNSTNNAFGKCVSARSRDEHAERDRSARNAAQTCKAERGTTPESRAAFRAKWGGGNNAFGKCVSTTARQSKAAEDAKDKAAVERRKNAAQTCDAERGETADSRAAFRARWGGKNNAFGKCVSRTARGLGPVA